MSEDSDLGIGSRVRHPDFGAGVVINNKSKTYMITFIDKGTVEVAKSYASMEIIDLSEPDKDQVSLAAVEQILQTIIRKYSDIQQTVALGEKWKGGKMVLYPANEHHKPKEIPIETFFHKITMLRDRLRVMEQRINSSKGLEEEEKINSNTI